VEVKGSVAADYTATVEALCAGQAQVSITDAGPLYNATSGYAADLILRDVRSRAPSYASMAVTNNTQTYCPADDVAVTYPASGDDVSYCNGIEPGDEAGGEGPAGLDALGKIEPGTKVALQAATSPAGYQYPIVNMQEQGVDTSSDIEEIPVEGNNNAVL